MGSMKSSSLVRARAKHRVSNILTLKPDIMIQLGKSSFKTEKSSCKIKLNLFIPMICTLKHEKYKSKTNLLPSKLSIGDHQRGDPSSFDAIDNKL